MRPESCLQESLYPTMEQSMASNQKGQWTYEILPTIESCLSITRQALSGHGVLADYLYKRKRRLTNLRQCGPTAAHIPSLHISQNKQTHRMELDMERVIEHLWILENPHYRKKDHQPR